MQLRKSPLRSLALGHQNGEQVFLLMLPVRTDFAKMACMIVLIIALSIPTLAILWWYWAHGRLRALPNSRRWQAAVAGFSMTVLATFVWLSLHRFSILGSPPPGLLAMLMLWGLIFLPFLAVPQMGLWGGRLLWRTVSRIRGVSDETTDVNGFFATLGGADSSREPRLSRREMVAASLVTFPMLATLGTTAYSLPQKRKFRVRDLQVDIPGLPMSLDGLRIAQISDVHVGKFTRGTVLRHIAETTNRLEADLVVLTGDLIDYTIHDLPEALEMIDLLQPAERVVMIEGNHDLFDGRDRFTNAVREHGVSLLLDEARTLRVRDTPVQLLGIRWHGRGQGIDPHVDRVAELRDPDAFPILLAHHPHAFDRAVEHQLPLTLAGHTHGGQLMATATYGAGPMLFKYVSGLYRQSQSSLVVSNGVGNWFPLRTNAPAEIVHVILRRG